MNAELAAILSEGEELFEDFDGTRDRLLALPPEAVPDLLASADDPAHAGIRGLLWYGLADWAYPPALERLVGMLAHEIDDIVIAGAFALDHLAGGRFDVENRFVHRGWPDYDAMRTVLAPEVRAWWAEEGRARLPTVEAWRAGARSRPAPHPHSFDLALVGWVLSNGIALTGRKVAVDDRGEELPANHGMHLVPATARDAEREVRAVALVDSDAGRILAALVPDPSAEDGWRVLDPAGVVPDFRTAGVPAPEGPGDG